MAKQRVKRIASRKTADTVPEDLPYEKVSKSSQDTEVECWSSTIRRSRDLEIDNLRTGLQLLRSYFSEEQIQTPVLQFFEENLPNFSILKSVEHGNIEVHRKGNDCSSSMNQKYYDKLGEPSDSQLLGLQDTFRTPGVNIQRQSFEMTPNTVRLPKHGEMLFSVRGSPLGVYNKQDNMEAISESEEG